MTRSDGRIVTEFLKNLAFSRHYDFRDKMCEFCLADVSPSAGISRAKEKTDYSFIVSVQGLHECCGDSRRRAGEFRRSDDAYSFREVLNITSSSDRSHPLVKFLEFFIIRREFS